MVQERRRRERRGEIRRLHPRSVAEPDERRAVLNPNGRRVDDRRRAMVARAPLSVPGGLRRHAAQVRFLVPEPAEDKRLAVAESLRLVVEFQLGDRDAFRAIYDRHFDGVYRYLLTALRDRHEAEDGAQDVFIRTLRGLSRYEFRGTPFEAWLFRIVRNYTLNVKRRSAPVRPADPARLDLWRDQRGLAEPGGVPADENLLALIERLPPSQRQVLALRYMVGLDWGDIAAVLDRSNGAVRQLEQRALTYLRTRLQATDPAAGSRTRSLPMRRRVRPSPVATSRRAALGSGISAA